MNVPGQAQFPLCEIWARWAMPVIPELAERGRAWLVKVKGETLSQKLKWRTAVSPSLTSAAVIYILG